MTEFRSEPVPHELDHSQQMAEYARSIEALADPVTRRDYFEHMTGDDFIDLTQQVASIVRTGDAAKYQPFDGDKVKLLVHEVPDQRDKETLLRETWSTAQSFLHDRELSDEDALEYAAITAAGGFLLVHPFIDSNGRTSRYLSFMIAEGGDDEAALHAMTPSMSGEWHVTPNYRAVKVVVPEYTNEQPREIEWKSKLWAKNEDALGGAIASSLYKNRVIKDFIETADEPTRQLIESCAVRDADGALESINGDKLLAVLANDKDRGIGYAKQLIDLERHIRTDYVRHYLASIRRDDYNTLRVLNASYAEPYEEKTEDELKDMYPEWRELYEQRKEERALLVKVLGDKALNGLVRIRDEEVAAHQGYSRYVRRKY